jgi:hypothetical protein
MIIFGFFFLSFWFGRFGNLVITRMEQYIGFGFAWHWRVMTQERAG